MNKTAVVFGGTGFIGRLVVSRLAQAGYTVRVPTRVLAHAEPLRQMGTPGQVAALLVDVRNVGAVSDVLRHADVAINCIGLLAQTRANPFDVIQGEIPGIIARAAHAAGVKHLVHLSAIGADANNASKYARSKAAGEGVVHAVFPSAVILRPSVVFGAADNFFNRFAHWAQMLPFLPLIGGGATRFQPVYVGDVANAIAACLTEPWRSEGKTYELGGPAIYTFKQLMQITLRETRRHRLLLTMPVWLAMLKARVLEKLPGQILTVDQVVLLQHDNIVGAKAKTLADLGINATALEAVLPTYLDQYRPKGRF